MKKTKILELHIQSAVVLIVTWIIVWFVQFALLGALIELYNKYLLIQLMGINWLFVQPIATVVIAIAYGLGYIQVHDFNYVPSIRIVTKTKD
jgi:hypothetical protein